MRTGDRVRVTESVIELCAAQLFGYSLDQFSRQLATAGLGSNISVASIAPVDGYTLEAQLRQLDGQPSGFPALAPSEPASTPVPPPVVR